MTLGWQQPYGTLMLPPYNKIETRSRRTHVRGKVLIYTTLKPMQQDKLEDVMGNSLELEARITSTVWDDPTELLDGYAIGVGNLYDCRLMQASDANLTFTRFDPKLWCWLFKDVRRIQPFEFARYEGDKRKSLGGQGWGTLQQQEYDQIVYL